MVNTPEVKTGGQAWRICLVSCANPIPDSCMGSPMGFMVGFWMVFGVVVSPVFGACIPVVAKLILRCMASQPPELHIYHLASFRDNGIVNNPRCCGVVCLDGGFGLRPSHVDESLAMWEYLTSCDKESGKF